MPCLIPRIPSGYRARKAMIMIRPCILSNPSEWLSMLPSAQENTFTRPLKSNEVRFSAFVDLIRVLNFPGNPVSAL
jgi:hypothetical protein